MEYPDFKPFKIVGLRANKDLFGTTFTGELVNNNSDSFHMVAVSVLLRDHAGKLVAGYSGFADDVPASGKVAFEVSSLGEVPDGATIEAYAQPWM